MPADTPMVLVPLTMSEPMVDRVLDECGPVGCCSLQERNVREIWAAALSASPVRDGEPATTSTADQVGTSEASASDIEAQLSAYPKGSAIRAGMARVGIAPTPGEGDAPVAWTDQRNMDYLKRGSGAATVWPTNHGASTPFALYTRPTPAAPEGLREKERLFDTICDLCGYVEDGSNTTFKLAQDDATRTWTATSGSRWEWGRSPAEAIEKLAAALQPQAQETDR